MASNSVDEQQLPEAIPVKRETLRKARVELLDLPIALYGDEQVESEDGPDEESSSDLRSDEEKVTEKDSELKAHDSTLSQSKKERKLEVNERTPVTFGEKKKGKISEKESSQMRQKIEPVSRGSSEKKFRPMEVNGPSENEEPASNETNDEAEGESSAPDDLPKLVEQEASINRKALESTNRGINPSSRRFVRGILHPLPISVALAAFWALLFRLSFIVFVVSMILFVMNELDARQYWWLAVICPVAGLFHLVSASQIRCRVCGQKEFWPSGAHKHVKTHRFLLMGPIFSTALHLLLFKWFHCMFCGTAVRIKK